MGVGLLNFSKATKKDCRSVHLTTYFPELQAEQLLNRSMHSRTWWWAAHSISEGFSIYSVLVYQFQWDTCIQSIWMPQSSLSVLALPEGGREVPWALLFGWKSEMSWCDQRNTREFAKPLMHRELPLCMRYLLYSTSSSPSSPLNSALLTCCGAMFSIDNDRHSHYEIFPSYCRGRKRKETTVARTAA